MKRNIVVCGHICVDLIPIIEGEYNSTDDIVVSGGLTNIGPINFSGGGPVFNVGKAISKILDPKKYELILIAKTGKDFLSSILKKVCNKNNLKISLIEDKTLETSYTIAIATKNIDRAYLHYSGANNSFTFKDIKFPKKGIPGIFHFGYPPLMKKIYENEGKELRLLLKKAKNLGYVTSIDMSLVSENSEPAKKNWRKIAKNIFPFTDILFLSFEEAKFILNTSEYFKKRREFLINHRDFSLFFTKDKILQIKEQLFKLGAGLIILKAGSKGAYLFSKDHFNSFSKQTWKNLEIFKQPPEIKDFKNAVGAGDNFAAGFINSYINSIDPKKCLEDATNLAVKSLSEHIG